MNITKNISKHPKAQVEVQITIPWADLEPRWDEILTKMAQDVEIAGFRKGTAPLNLVEQNLGRKLEDEVFKVVFPQALIEALQGTDIVPIDYPQYQITSFQKGGELKFSAKITERPTVTVGNYKTIKVQRSPLKPVTQEDVDKIVDDLYKRWKVRNPSTSSGQPPQSTQGTTGTMSFNPQPNGRGDIPDDTFAKAVGAQSLADLKVKIRGDLENEAKYNNELDWEETILQEVEKITQVDIPEILIQDELNRMLVSLQRSVTERGLLMDEYLRGQNKTVDQLKSEWRPQAERNVRMELGLSEVAKAEGVNISNEELQAEIDKIQDARVKAQFAQEEPKMHLRHALRQTKTLNLLKTIVG